MRLLIGVSDVDGLMVHKSFVSSFLIYDHQSLPTVLGVEYAVPEGIVRTFSDYSSSDFLLTLQRSGLSQSDRMGIVPGIPCMFCAPFLGKGATEWVADVFRLLAINDRGKELFAACRSGLGKFVTATYGDNHFEKFVKSVF